VAWVVYLTWMATILKVECGACSKNWNSCALVLPRAGWVFFHSAEVRYFAVFFHNILQHNVTAVLLVIYCLWRCRFEAHLVGGFLDDRKLSAQLTCRALGIILPLKDHIMQNSRRSIQLSPCWSFVPHHTAQSWTQQ